MARMRVVVLTGGSSAEREICLQSGAKVMAALDPARYDAVAVDLAQIMDGRAEQLAGALMAPADYRPKALGNGFGTEVPKHQAHQSHQRQQSAALSAQGERAVERAPAKPDVVFIALHGGAGENGTVQGMLDLFGIPYVGSGVLASAMALNKIVAKKLFEREGIPTPKWAPLSALRRASAAKEAVEAVGLPCVIKPATEGSSLGVSIVRKAEQMEPALELAFQYGREALAEEFIAGVEITGPVLGNDDPQVLPLVEIVPSTEFEFYDYAAKYTAGATDEIIPARITEAQAERARELTMRAHRTLGCRGMSRVDMIVGANEVYVLELQTIPGLTGTSLLPRAAEAAGISFPLLVDRLIELALEEHERNGSRRGV
jgi:D-alanine-D-alanine ligase